VKSDGVGDAASGARGVGWVRLDTRVRWEDLVIPEGAGGLLRSISGELSSRGRVRPNGGQSADGPASGLRLLFAGEPGTGKRLAVRILAADHGLAVLSIDLASVFSQNRGETERRLNHLFAAATRSHAVMYFADAGAWFGERAPGWTSEDPSAEGGVSALLRRIDAHRGVVVFAATLGIARVAVIDRLDVVVDFPFPHDDARRTIWRLLLPAGARLQDRELDFLAASFSLSGGDIHSCCIVAGSAAALEGVPVELRHVITGLEQKLRGRPYCAREHEALERFHGGTWAGRRLAAMPGREPTPRPRAAQARFERAGRRRRLSGRLLAVLVLGGVLVAAVLGFLLAREPGSSAPRAPALDRHAAAGLLRVSFPNTWRLRTPPSGPRLGLTDELALAPEAPGGGVLMIGRTATRDPTLLPQSLLRALSHAPAGQIVTFDGARLYRYLNLSPSDANWPESVYALPTTIGTVLAVCVEHGAVSSFASSCERVIATIRLASGSVLAIGPMASYASALDAAITKLNAAHSVLGSKLRNARTVADQAKAANELATVYFNATTAVGRLSAGTAQAANLELASALRSTGDGYAALGGAAAHHDASGYAAARSSLAHAASALTAAFVQLASFGYAVA
jgi:hypothetical protein